MESGDEATITAANLFAQVNDKGYNVLQFKSPNTRHNRSICLPVCRSVCRSVGPAFAFLAVLSILSHFKSIKKIKKIKKIKRIKEITKITKIFGKKITEKK